MIERKVLLSSAVLTALAFGFASCKTNEDVNGMIKKIESEEGFTNDTDTVYSRGYVSTTTKHLASDCKIEIDTSISSGTYTMGYIFNQIGKGTPDNPYSFFLVGIKYGTTDKNSTIRPLYFISYYTGVLSEDFTSNAGDFDISKSEAETWSNETGQTVVANNATEYPIVSVWTDLKKDGDGTQFYTLKNDILTVYIDLSVYSGETEVTKENYKDYMETVEDADGQEVTKIKNGYYKVKFKANENEDNGLEKTLDKTTVKTTFDVQEAKLGKYAMVKKDSKLKGSWNFPSSSYIKSALANSDVIIWDYEINNLD